MTNLKFLHSDMKTIISYAPDAWKFLNGVFCVYKPAGMITDKVRKMLLANLTRDLNSLDQRPVRQHVAIQGEVSSGQSMEVHYEENLADHPLVLGPRYQMDDIRMETVQSLGYSTSGLQVFAVNGGCYKTKILRSGKYLKAYRLKGKFGIATSNNYLYGDVLEKSTYHHITAPKLHQILSSIQAAHQRQMFQFSGVDMHSQEAYEMASTGMIRPADKSKPLIYKIKCVNFKLPDFTLEINCINETESYLLDTIAEIGLYLKSTATCSQIQCIQYGHLKLEDALLRKHWSLQHVLTSIANCRSRTSDKHLTPTSALLSTEKTNFTVT